MIKKVLYSSLVAALLIAGGSGAKAQYLTGQTTITTPTGTTVTRSNLTGNNLYGNTVYGNNLYGTNNNPINYGAASSLQTIMPQQNTPQNTPQYGAVDANGPNGWGADQNAANNLNNNSSPLTAQEQAVLGNNSQRRIGMENSNPRTNNTTQPTVNVTNLNNAGSSVLPGARFRGYPQVIDGSSFVLEGQKIVLNGVNVPSLDQQCNAGVVNYWCGQEAKARLQELVSQGPVVCLTVQDIGSSLIANCSVGFDSLNKAMAASNFTVPSYQMDTGRRVVYAPQNRRSAVYENTQAQEPARASVTPSHSLN